MCENKNKNFHRHLIYKSNRISTGTDIQCIYVKNVLISGEKVQIGWMDLFSQNILP